MTSDEKERIVIEFSTKNKKHWKRLSADLNLHYEDMAVFLMEFYEKHPELWARIPPDSPPQPRPEGVY